MLNYNLSFYLFPGILYKIDPRETCSRGSAFIILLLDKGEGLPRNVNGLLFGEYLVDMEKKREFLGIYLAEL